MSNPFTAPPADRIAAAIESAGVIASFRPSNLPRSSHPALAVAAATRDVPAPTNAPRPANNGGSTGGDVSSFSPGAANVAAGKNRDGHS